MRVSTAVFVAFSAVVTQFPVPPPPPPMPAGGQPPRDVVRRPEPTGTGVIRGRVVTADSGSPVRRASVNLQHMPTAPAVPPPPPPPGMPPGTTIRTTTTMTVTTASGGLQMNMPGMNAIRPRTATTDAQGGFEFTGLPAGTYRIFASPGTHTAGYLGVAYGGTRPVTMGMMDAGTPIELTDGQRFEKATIALPRGAVITGRVTDDNGDPMARVQVYTMHYAPGSTRAQRSGGGSQTDDLGHFRLYGLAPGEYVVVAESSRNTFVQPNAPPENEEDKIGFMTTYYPGTADEAAAQRVRARAGGETPGVEIRMVVGRMFRISGIVTDSQGQVARTSGQLFKRVGSSTSSFGFSTDEQGRFAMRNIPPGNYRLVVRGRNPPPGPQAAEQREPTEMAVLPLNLVSDLDGLVVMTQPGATITGQVVFEGGPPQLAPNQQSFQMRVSGMNADPEGSMGMSSPQQGVVTPDLTFTMRGLFGELLLRTSGPNMFLKSVTVNGQDVTDTPREFKNGDQVTMVMTTRASTVEGTVTDAAGKPIVDGGILIFSDDKSSWRASSTRTRRSSIDPSGRYRVMGLLPGRYYAIALPRERMNISMMNQDAAWFEQLAKEATTFVVGEDEQRQVDLKIAAGNAGG